MSNHFRHFLSAVLGLLAMQASWSLALAQPAGEGAALYAVTYWDQQLITINTNTGTGTVVTNLAVAPRDLAARDGLLFVYSAANQAVRLSRIDPWTGIPLQSVTFSNKIGGGEGGMDFRADGLAFATTVNSSTGTLFRLDMATTNAVLLTSEGGQSPGFDGLAFDSNGVLFGLTQNRAGAFGLYLIDQTTGEPVLVGDLGVNFPFNGGAVAGLAFAPNGDLFAALGSPIESKLYRLNKSNGSATLVGSVGLAGVAGLRFLNPPPGPLTIQNLGSVVRLSWPHARGGVLQFAASVTGSWTNVVQAVSTNGAEASALWPQTSDESFFRLKR